MIAIRMAGGLGNCCFQIATGETWRRHGYDVVYTQVDENLAYCGSHYQFKRHTEEYKKLFKNFNWYDAKAKAGDSFRRVNVPFTYVDIKPEEGCEYVGYFQSEKNFPDKKFVKWLFEPSEFTRAYLNFPICEHSCSIHVRRQDYLALGAYHNNLGRDYYEKALMALPLDDIDKFYVFSDDIEWCKKSFEGDEFEFVNCMEWAVIYLMGYCKYNIIANSSLSWWGAYLNDTEGRIVIAPQLWFGPKGENAKDLIPEGWVKI